MDITVKTRRYCCRSRVQIWLFDQSDLRVEGRIAGFDEYMNIVLDEAEEISVRCGGGDSGEQWTSGGRCTGDVVGK